RRPGLHPRPRDDGHRSRRRCPVRHPRHQRWQRASRRRRPAQHGAQRGLGHAAAADDVQPDRKLRGPHDQHRAPARADRAFPLIASPTGHDTRPMKITDIQFGMLRVPLKTPFKTALRTVERVEDIVVMVHNDSDQVGYGEAPATAVITGDTHGSIVDAIRHYISPRLIGEDIADLNRITRLIQTSMEKNSSAKAAVEIAVYDLWGQLYNAPLYKMLGGGDPVITTDITISVDTID